MGRIRTIKPEFWTDEKVGELKRDERLLFLGLLNLADDEGALKATPAFIKGQIFAYDEDLTIADVKVWLEGLTLVKMLLPFDHNGEKFFLIRTFKDHQKINRPTPSKIPKNVLTSILNAYSLNTHGILTDDSVAERKGKEGNKEREIEGNGKEADSSTPQVDNILIDKIMKFFGFTEITNYDKMRDILAFINCLTINNRHHYFQQQFDAYVEYKTINDSYVHKFKNFLGTHSMLFEDGAWNEDNWVAKLQTEKNKQHGKGNQSNSGRRSHLNPPTNSYTKL
ncbi:hypothetical protein [Pedobacter metabolipauper]|uniref:Uncharacterized protein n=1 Tax=Pedobacter metabolipauper TaxID=425513 RepID=A0A4R6SZV6_9SPHI|nr:hypothetical protein [Pedobacter metabolipauper]TDQ12204.1 hypothetical protein ATK78_1338 [Pedobacter metabolipauper]